MFLTSLGKTVFPAICYSAFSGFAGSGQGMQCIELSKVAVVTACTSGAFSSEAGGRGAAFCPATVTTTVLPAFRSSLTLASVLVMNASMVESALVRAHCYAVVRLEHFSPIQDFIKEVFENTRG